MDKKKNHSQTGDADHKAEGEQSATGGVKPADPYSTPEERISQLEEALAARETEAAGNWDKFLRERADLENFRKRTNKEKEEILKYGNESLILEILPVIDTIERALAHTSEETQSAFVEGIRLTHGMLIAALKKFGAVPVEVAQGTPFDPALHHAVHQVVSDQLPPNTVAEVFQGGYLLNDRLLRAAMVVVTKSGE